MLVKLNVYNFRVIDVPVTPVYGIGERSGMKMYRVIPKMSWLLLRRFLWRMKEKYIIRDFHPLVFFYALGMFLLLTAVPLGVRLIWKLVDTGLVRPINALAFAFTVITGFQLLLFAMWFDMEYNKHLK